MTTGWIRHQRWRQLHGDYGLAAGLPALEPAYDLVLGGAGWLRQHSGGGPGGLRTATAPAQVSTAAGLLACLRLRLSHPHGCFFGVLHAGAEFAGHMNALEHAVAADCHAASQAMPEELQGAQQPISTRGGGSRAGKLVLSTARVPMDTLQAASSPGEEAVWLGSRDVFTSRRRKPQVFGHTCSAQRTVTRREAVAHGMPYALVTIRWAY